jgi:hypothetical protein
MLRSVFLHATNATTHATTHAATNAPTHTLLVCRGPDWCLQELQNAAGESVRSWSYEIDRQGMVDDVLHLQVTARGRDWVGDCLLETGQYPCWLCKEDEKGCVLQFGMWEQILWKSDGGWAEARAWALAPASAVAASAVAASAVATSAGRSPLSHPFRSTQGHSVPADRRGDHRGDHRGGHRGRPYISRAASSGGGSSGEHGVPASASVICKIRLSGS